MYTNVQTCVNRKHRIEATAKHVSGDEILTFRNKDYESDDKRVPHFHINFSSAQWCIVHVDILNLHRCDVVCLCLCTFLCIGGITCPVPSRLFNVFIEQSAPNHIHTIDISILCDKFLEIFGKLMCSHCSALPLMTDDPERHLD